jgi:predicted transcriptional regulator
MRQEKDVAPSTMEKIESILPTLAPDEQDGVLDFIEAIRGRSILDDLSVEDQKELDRRIATVDLTTAIPLETVMSDARKRLAKFKR